MRSAERIVLAYIVAAGLWIVLSDSVVMMFDVDVGAVQLAKGLLFVAITAAVLWIVLSREQRLRDVTAAHAEASRKALEDREVEYRALFESNPQPMWVYDHETSAFLAANAAAIEAYGYSLEEFLLMCVSDVESHDREPAVASLLSIDTTNGSGRVTVHSTKSGELRLVDITSNKVHFEGRSAELVLAHDVTARLRAQQALDDAKRQVEAIIDTSPMAIILLDREAKVRLWNPAAEKMFGWSAEEVVGAFDPIVPEAWMSEFTGAFERTLQGHNMDGARLHTRSKTGEEVSTVCFAAALIGQTGEPEGAIGMFADIGELVRSELELKQYRERLEELVQARTAELSIANRRLMTATKVKSEFLANMSHELRTPLNSVIGFSGAMLQGLAGELNEEQRKQLGMVYRSGKHLLELINDILDLSKIEAGRFTVEVQEFDVGEIIMSVVDSLGIRASTKDLDVQVVVPKAPLLVTTDRTKIRQILINLIGNAVKFTDAGSVEIDGREVDGELVIAVKDTGPGVPEADMLLIFDEFTQSKRSADEKPQGTGLGLAISRRLARILGGDIEVHSVLGNGSTFSLRVPSRYAAQKDGPTSPGDIGAQGAQLE